MASVTEEISALFYLILISLNVNSCTWLMATYWTVQFYVTRCVILTQFITMGDPEVWFGFGEAQEFTSARSWT